MDVSHTVITTVITTSDVTDVFYNIEEICIICVQQYCKHYQLYKFKLTQLH